MKINVSRVMTTLEGNPMERRELSDKFKKDTPLTVGFTLANVLAVATEDIAVLDTRAHQTMQEDERNALRKRAYDAKLQRGQLAQRLYAAEADGGEIELSPAELVLIQQVVGPRLMPVMLAQVHDIIN
jgi:hypothetical protein